jgi:hypothetical protein
MARRSKDDKLYDTLVALKRHLRSCSLCDQARKALAPDFMCRTGMMLVLVAAEGYDSIIKLRIQAHADPSGHVFACPDLAKHGKAYSITTPALHVTAIQDMLS